MITHIVGLAFLALVAAVFARRILEVKGTMTMSNTTCLYIPFARDRQLSIGRDPRTGIVWASPCDDPCEGIELDRWSALRALRRSWGVRGWDYLLVLLFVLGGARARLNQSE